MLHLQTMALAVVIGGIALIADAATYYVDFEGGNNQNTGLSADQAWKHSPGDNRATDKPKEVQLAAGDRVIFKGGVRYRGTITVTQSGDAENPITLDGNNEGTFGEGKAIIDGGAVVDGWQRLTSIEQAKGNPNWEKIFVTTIRPSDSWLTLGLADDQGPLPIAQSPNPRDSMFQTRAGEYFQTEDRFAADLPVRLAPKFGANVNGQRPLIHVVTAAAGSAVLSPVVGSGFSVTLSEPITISKVGIAMQPNYTAVKDLEIYGDDKLLKTVTLEKDARDIQTFDLDEAVKVRELTYKFISAHGEVAQNWTAIRRVAAYHEGDTNLLEFNPTCRFADPANLTSDDPAYYNDMKVAIHGGANTVIRLDVLGFDPATNTLKTSFFSGQTYPQTRYALFNSVKLIDMPGEYATEPTENGQWLLYFMPRQGDAPTGIRRTMLRTGIATNGASHVVIRGFSIQTQGGRRAAGVDMSGGSHITIGDTEVTGVAGGTGIASVNTHHIRIERAHVHHNPDRTKGIVLRNGTHCDVIDSRLDRNTSTGLDYYNVQHGRVAGNVVTGHHGIHANGITFYLGCTDLIIEGNQVYDGNVALTIQQAENILIRNNVFDGDGSSMAVGMWVAQPFKNVRFYHNAMIRSNAESDWATGLFSNNRGPEGLIVKNNIIDARYGTLPGEFSHNIYTRLSSQQDKDKLGPGEIVVENLSDLMVDPANRDYRIKPGSPAINAGVKLDEVDTDFAGTPRPQGEASDIGPYEHR